MMNLNYNDEPKRGAIYARVSSDSQDVNNSIEAQIAECEEFAKRHNIVIVKIYIDEVETGLVSSRAQFQEMMGDASANEKHFDVILVWKFSRFSRDKYDNAIYKSRLQKRGVRIVSIKEPIDDSPAGQMMENMIESMDAFYSANLSQDVRRGQRQVAIRGYYPGNFAPYGYKIKKVKEEDGKALHNTFVADPPRDQIVRRVFLETIAGRSQNEIRAGLIQDGIPAAKGGKWADSTLHQMLHNLHYAGYIVWGVNSKSGEPPVVAKGKHEGIVTKEEFDLASEIMASKFRTVINPRQTASEYMMTGMLKCRLCGRNLVGRLTKDGSIRHYVCGARKEDGATGCALPYVNVKNFDQKVLSIILDDILSPQNVQVAIDKIAQELSGPYEQQAATVMALEQEIRKVQDSQDRIMTAYEEGAYTVTDFAKRMDTLRSKQAQLEKQRAEAARQLDDQAAIIANPQTVLAFCRDVSELIRNSSDKERKQVLRRFVKCVWIEPGRAKILYRLPLPKDGRNPEGIETELALDEEPVRLSTLLSPHARG